MSIQDEHDLRAQLSGLMDGIEVRPAPVPATIRRGRRIRTGRYVSVAAGVAAAAVLAAVLPGVLTGRPHSASPVTPQHYTVRVTALGPTARGGVIAAGVTDGKRWRVVASGPAKSPTVQAVGAIGAGTSATGVMPPAGTVSTEAIGDSRYNTVFGTVSSAVTSVVIQLPDGERPVLTPVSWGGARWVAVVVPAGVPIVRAAAYSGARELVYAIPFRGDQLVTWWRPGQAGPARVTKTIGSGVIDGKPWRATAWVGPWGWCYSLGGGTACYGVLPKVAPGSQLLSMATCSPAMGTAPATGVVLAASAVTRVIVRFSDGASASFRPVKVGGSRVFGYAIPAHVRVTSSAEYGPDGLIIGSGHGQDVGGERTPGWGC